MKTIEAGAMNGTATAALLIGETITAGNGVTLSAGADKVQLTPQEALKADGLPEAMIRAPETKEQQLRRMRVVKATTGPTRNLRDPGKCKPIGAVLPSALTIKPEAGAKTAAELAGKGKKKPAAKKVKAPKVAKAKPASDKPAAASDKPAAKSVKAPVEGKRTSKTDLIAGMLTRKGGCTAAEVLAACGWTAVSMPAQAKAAGLTLKKDKVDGVTRYTAA